MSSIQSPRIIICLPELRKLKKSYFTLYTNGILVYTVQYLYISLYSIILASKRLKLINPFLDMFNHVLSCFVHVHFNTVVVNDSIISLHTVFFIHVAFPRFLQHLRAENDETVPKQGF